MTTNVYSEARANGDPLPVPERVLTIGAHPDDAEFGAGGTLAGWSASGAHITMLVVSDGSKGTWDPSIPHEALVSMRAAEQRAAADALGAAEVVMLEHTDGELENTRELRKELCYWIRATRPDVVLSHDPWKRYMLHPDHRATGMAAVDAVVAARDHLFFPEQLTDSVSKHRPQAILLWAADEPDHWVDISATFDAKLAALMAHSSQGTTTMGDAHAGDDRRTEFEARMRAWAAGQGAQVGIELAESFKRLTP